MSRIRTMAQVGAMATVLWCAGQGFASADAVNQGETLNGVDAGPGCEYTHDSTMVGETMVEGVSLRCGGNTPGGEGIRPIHSWIRCLDQAGIVHTHVGQNLAEGIGVSSAFCSPGESIYHGSARLVDRPGTIVL